MMIWARVMDIYSCPADAALIWSAFVLNGSIYMTSMQPDVYWCQPSHLMLILVSFFHFHTMTMFEWVTVRYEWGESAFDVDKKNIFRGNLIFCTHNFIVLIFFSISAIVDYLFYKKLASYYFHDSAKASNKPLFKNPHTDGGEKIFNFAPFRPWVRYLHKMSQRRDLLGILGKKVYYLP